MGSRAITERTRQVAGEFGGAGWDIAEEQVFREFPQKNFPTKISEVLGDFHRYDFPVGTTYLGILFRRRFLEVYI